MNNEENKTTIKRRYSDEDLVAFKQVIDDKMIEAKGQLEDLLVQLKELNNSGDENRAGTFDDGASNSQREHISKLAARQQKFVRNLEYALVRIKNKTYGVCSVTGELISRERLAIVPHATKSIDAKHNTQGKARNISKPKFFKE
jgi:RNA polymerase-binding transcription factor DksA